MITTDDLALGGIAYTEQKTSAGADDGGASEAEQGNRLRRGYGAGSGRAAGVPR
jgi:hypothetical protein